MNTDPSQLDPNLTTAQIGSLPGVPVAGTGEEHNTLGTTGSFRRAAEDALLDRLEREEQEAGEAFAGTPTAFYRDRLEYSRLSSTARLWLARPDEHTDEEFGALFQNLHNRRFPANAKVMTAFDRPGEENPNRGRLQDFLDFTDKLDSSPDLETRKQMLSDKMLAAFPDLAEWERAKQGPDGGAAYAKAKLGGFFQRDMLEGLEGIGRKLNPNDWLDYLDHKGTSTELPKPEIFPAWHDIEEYDKKFTNDRLIFAATQLMPFLHPAQRNFVQLAASGADAKILSGLIRGMKPEDRELMLSLAQAVRPEFRDIPWLPDEELARFGTSVSSSARSIARALRTADKLVMFEADEKWGWLNPHLHVYDDFTREQMASLRQGMLDDIREYEALSKTKFRDPEGFLDKAISGFFDSAPLQVSTLAGASLIQAGMPLIGTPAGNAMLAGGVALEGYMFASMIGEHFDNLLLHGVSPEDAILLAIPAGIADGFVENMDISLWKGFALNPVELRQIGWRGALRTYTRGNVHGVVDAIKAGGPLLKANLKQALAVTTGELLEETIQAANKAGVTQIADGKSLIEAYTSSATFDAALDAMVEAIPTCTAFGFTGALDLTGQARKNSLAKYSDNLDLVARAVARAEGKDVLNSEVISATTARVKNNADRVAAATAGMSAKERAAWLDGQEDFTPAERAFYAEAAALRETLTLEDGKVYAAAVLSGSLDEALFAEHGIKLVRDNGGNVVRIQSEDGEIDVPVSAFNRAASVDDLGPSGIADLIDEALQEKGLDQKTKARLADIQTRLGEHGSTIANLTQEDREYLDNFVRNSVPAFIAADADGQNRITLFLGQYQPGTGYRKEHQLVHELTHDFLDSLRRSASIETRKAFKAIFANEELAAKSAEAQAAADLVRTVLGAEPDSLDLKALASNAATLLKRVVTFGRAKGELKSIWKENAKGQIDPQAYWNNMVGSAISAWREYAERLKAAKAEREKKRARKMELRKAAKDAQDEANRKAAEAEAERKAAEEAAEEAADAARKAAEDQLRSAEEATQKREAANREMQFFLSRLASTPPRLVPAPHLDPTGREEDALAAQRGQTAFLALWKLESWRQAKDLARQRVDIAVTPKDKGAARKELAKLEAQAPLADDEFTRIEDEYGLPRAFLLDPDSLSPESQERLQDGLLRLWSDAGAVRIAVPAVYVATETDKARVLPNEVWNPLKQRFETGEVIVDPSRAQPFTPEASSSAEEDSVRYSIAAREWDALEAHFGVTDNPAEAGWIDPRGKMLDFSGAHWTANRKAPNPGHRTVDHSDVKEVLDRPTDENWRYRWEMLEAGAIRVMPEDHSLGIAQDITPEQEDAIYDWIDGMRTADTPFTVEFHSDEMRTADYRAFPPRVSARAVINAIHDHFRAPSGRNKVAGVAYPDASDEIRAIPDTRFSIGNRKREEMKALILKKRPDVGRMFAPEQLGVSADDDLSPAEWRERGADKAVDEIAKFATPKEQKAALNWFIKGAIRLPEDAPKVDEALRYAETAKGKANTDALSYASPMAMIDALHDFKPKAKPIDPDKVPQLSDRRDMGHGVVTYLVQDDREGQQAMREIINTHWGEDANPWCLLQGDGHGNLSDGSDGGYDAWYYWENYSALPKRVAFKDGKLLAFMATDEDSSSEYEHDLDLALEDAYEQYANDAALNGDEVESYDEWSDNAREYVAEEYGLKKADFIEEKWWDRQDKSHEGIPLGNIPVPNDPFNRWAWYEIRDGQPKQIGGYYRDLPGEDYISWYQNGIVAEKNIGGVYWSWNENGRPTSYDNKSGSGEGLYVMWDDNGALEHIYSSRGGSSWAPEHVAAAMRIYNENLQAPPQSTHFSVVTPAEDAAYMDAVQRGDKETAQRMVREAAKKAMPNTKVVDKKGNPLVVYHGTISREHFTEFNERPIYAFHRENLASQYTNPRQDLWVSPTQTGRVMPVFMNLEHPLEVNAERHLWRNIRVEWSDTPVTTEDIVKYAKENGYDGVIIKRVRDNLFDDDTGVGDEYIAFSSSQVKSIGAEYEREHIGFGYYGDRIASMFVPTRDDAGNVIPLSQRFNPARADIRFSIVSAVRDSLPDYVANSQSFDGIDEDTGAARFSLATYRAGGRKTLEKWLKEDSSLSLQDAKAILDETDRIAKIARTYAGKKELVEFGNWSEARVEADENGRPMFGVVRTNGDYAMNIDFSTVCKKRRPMDRIFARLVRDGVLTGANVNELTGEKVAAIQDIIKRHGLEVACALCFVDAKRYRLGDVAKRFADGGTTSDGKRFAGWNNLVDEQAKGGKKWTSRVKKAQGKTDFESRCILALDSDPAIRVKVDGASLVSSAGMDALARENPGIYTLWRSYGGTSHAKDSHWDSPYNNDIIRPFSSRVNDRAQNFSPEAAFAVGGVRLQSFSDFVGRMFFDYAQMFAELAGKRLPLHTYTKEPDFVKIFGETNAKINMSLVPAVVDGSLAPGLDANGDYAWADETFPPEKAWELRDSKGNIGTIAVGVSDAHIKKLLADKRIDMVIPYHASGINPVVANLRRIDEFVDYTKKQNTRNADGSKYTGKDYFDFYSSLKETKNPRKTAEAYLAWCDERGLLPKFDDFRADKNYFKLLVDFRVYDSRGRYSPQEAVRQQYPADVDSRILEALEADQQAAEAYSGAEDAIVEEIESSILPPQTRASIAVPDTTALKYFLAREIMEHNGRLPNPLRLRVIAHSFGLKEITPSQLAEAAQEAAEQTKVLRFIASDPKVEKLVARAGMSARYERAIERARATTLKFSQDVSESREKAKEAYRRTVRAVKGEDYALMMRENGIDINRLLLENSPTEKSAKELVALVKDLTEKFILAHPDTVSDLDENDVFASPIARAKLSANLAKWSQAVAAAYSPSHARIRIARKAQLLNDRAVNSLAALTRVGEEIFADLQRDAIRQTRNELIDDIKRIVTNPAKRFAERKEQKDRRNLADVEAYCKMVKWAMNVPIGEIEQTAKELEDFLSGYAAKDGVDNTRFRDFAEAQMKLAMLDRFSNLRAKTPAELVEIRDQLGQMVDEGTFEAMSISEEWEQNRRALVDAMAPGVVGDPKHEGREPEPGSFAKFLYSLVGMWETKWRQLTRFCTDGTVRARSIEASDTLEEMIQLCEDRTLNYRQQADERLNAVLTEVYGSGKAARDALTADIDKSLWRRLDRGDQHTEWTVGRLLAMYAACLQTADYGENMEKYGRDADYVAFLHRTIENIDPRHFTLIERLRDLLVQQGADISEVYVRTAGVPLLTPGTDYFPVQILRDKGVAKAAESRSYSPFAPSLTPRVKHGLDFDQQADIVELVQSRADDAAHTIGWAELGSTIMGVAQSDEVLNAIRQAHGRSVMSQWNNYILDIMAGTRRSAPGEEAKVVDWFMRTASRLALGSNLASWPKQIASVPCLALSRLASLKDVLCSCSFWALHPFEMAQVARDLAQTSAFRARYGVAISQELKYATQSEGAFKDWFSRFIDFTMRGVYAFDKLGVLILAGVYRRRRAELEMGGMSQAESSETAAAWLMHIVDKTAQTSRTLNTTQAQRAGGAVNLLLQFKSAPAQQTQFEVTAIQEALAQPKNAKLWKKALSCIFINHFIVPSINLAIETALLSLTGWGIPDEEKRKRLAAIFVANILSGSLGSIIFLGTVVESLSSAFSDLVVADKAPDRYTFTSSLPATRVMTQFFDSSVQIVRALEDMDINDIGDTAIEIATAIGASTPGISWPSRTIRKIRKSIKEK